jgi:hypothetical protein
MVRSTALLIAVAACFPATVAGQNQSRWFMDVGYGWSWPTSWTFERGSSSRVGIGVGVSPSVQLGLSGSAEMLPYSDQRFADLFPTGSHAGSLAARVLSLSGNVEWSPSHWGAVTPLVGLALSFQRRDVSGFIGSPAWVRCSTAARFVYSTDPDTGRSTLSVHNHIPEEGCADLRQDIDVDGKSLGLMSSAGLNWRFDDNALLAAVRVSYNLLPSAPVVSTDIAWRHYF